MDAGWPCRGIRVSVAANDRRLRCVLAAYVVLHYLFVSQTAHMLALFAVFLQLLFATNYFAAITHQGSSANLLFQDRRQSCDLFRGRYFVALSRGSIAVCADCGSESSS